MGKASPLSDARSLVGITLSGGYKTERLIDESGRGIVLAAKDPGGRPVAVKVLRPEAATEEMLSRVSRDASLLSKLNDRHVVPVLDVGQDLEHDLVYLVMPLLHGLDVAEVIERTGVLAPKTAAHIALQASRALVAAHAAGCLFRDLRPTKLFLEDTPGGDIVVRVLGPGLRDREGPPLDAARPAAPARSTTSRTGDAAREGRLADVFGLGAVLHEMLCGKPPQTDARPSGNPDAPVSSRRIAPIQDYAPWIEAPLALALQPALTADLHRRYPSAEAFSEMLHAVTAGEDRVTRDLLVPLDASARTFIAERADHEADPLVGCSLGGRYKILRLIGRGGMGGVYEAQGTDGRHVAAKVIFRSVAGQDDQHMRRFIREARAATAIDSLHVVKTFELGTDLKLGAPFIVMELLSGTDVARLLQEKGALLPPAAVRIFVQAARGLAAAHAVNIVHRDVKPANLFLHVAEPGQNVVVKVCDFGVAKRSEDGATHDLTRAGGVLGSPLYMSPEQAKTASHVDHRADVWGLCVSLYQTLSGSPPWDPNASLAELLLAICTNRVPPLAEAAPWVSRELAAVVHKGLAREPENRWPSMEALARALEPHTGGSDTVRLADLAAVPAADLARAPAIERLREGRSRSRSGRHVQNVTSHDDTADHDTLLSDQALAAPRRTRAGLFVGGAVALAALAGIWMLRPPPQPDLSAYLVHAAAEQHAMLRVPDGATVRVDGDARENASGTIPLSGEAGAGVDVLVSVGGIERQVRVILTRDGHAEPDHIDAPSAPAPSAPAPATSAGAPPGSSKPLVSRPSSPPLPPAQNEPPPPSSASPSPAPRTRPAATPSAARAAPPPPPPPPPSTAPRPTP
jgi:serine/threonine protein kinase